MATISPKQNTVAGVLGSISKRLIDAGKGSRKRFLKDGLEVMRYGYAPDYNFEYQTIAPKAFFKAKAALTAEAFAVIGPYLFPQTPVRVLEPRSLDPAVVRRTDILSQLLNYTPKEMDLRTQCRRAIIDAIGYGRGVVWTGRDAKTGLVYSMWDSVRNLITDPNARVPKERNWVARKRVRPRFAVIQEIPQAREAILKLPAYANRASDGDGRYEWENQDTTTDCICYYEVWSKVGLHNFKGGVELLKLMGAPPPDGTTGESPEAAGTMQADDSPLKYCVAEDGTLLYVSEWEVPFYEDDLFPVTELDFLENPDSDWPISPLAQALGYQRAINWLITLMMGKYRFTSRTFGALARASGLSPKDKDKVLIGGDIEMLEITTNGSETRKLSDYISEFQFSQDYLAVGMQFLDMLEMKYQKASGLYEILYSGDTGRQMRSAQEAALKERTSKTRIDDMKDKVAEWQATMARKEAMASRFLYTREDVTAILGEQAGNDWGFLVKPDRLSVETWAQENVAAGMMPDEAWEAAAKQYQQAVSLDSWRKEIDYSIESGSMRRRDIDTKIDALREMMNQAVPTQMQSADPGERALAYDSMAEYYEAIGVDKQLVEKYRAKAAELTQQAEVMQQMAAMGMPPPGGAPQGVAA
jgi:hypothetical protein